MKNILFLHTGADLYGADIVLLELLKGIDRSNFCPVVVLPEDGILAKKIKHEGVDVYIKKYPILRRKYFNVKGIFDYVSNYIRCSQEIVDLVKKKEIDLVYVNTVAVLEGVYISRKIKRPLIWHVHEIIDSPKFVNLFICFLLGRFADAIVAVSHAVEKHLLESKMINSKKINVIYNGIDSSVFNPNNEHEYIKKELHIPSDSFVVGMIGRINAIKGQDEFVEICKPLIKNNNNVWGIIVGNAYAGQEWRETELIERIEKEELNDKLLYIGYRKDIRNIHSLFDILVLPSVRPDSLPTVVLEAMASEKVVVGYKNGGISEMVVDGETGFLEEIYDHTSLSNDIDRLIHNKRLYDEMAKKGKDRQTELFSKETFISKIETLLLSINE